MGFHYDQTDTHIPTSQLPQAPQSQSPTLTFDGLNEMPGLDPRYPFSAFLSGTTNNGTPAATMASSWQLSSVPTASNVPAAAPSTPANSGSFAPQPQHNNQQVMQALAHRTQLQQRLRQQSLQSLISRNAGSRPTQPPSMAQNAGPLAPTPTFTDMLSSQLEANMDLIGSGVAPAAAPAAPAAIPSQTRQQQQQQKLILYQNYFFNLPLNLQQEEIKKPIVSKFPLLFQVELHKILIRSLLAEHQRRNSVASSSMSTEEPEEGGRSPENEDDADGELVDPMEESPQEETRCPLARLTRGRRRMPPRTKSKTGEGEQLYSCKSCEKQFEDSTKLRKHSYTHSPKKFVCASKDCGKRFHTRKDLRRHQQTVHDKNTMRKVFICTCEGCDRGILKPFSRKDNAKQHVTSVHNGQDENENQEDIGDDDVEMADQSFEATEVASNAKPASSITALMASILPSTPEAVAAIKSAFSGKQDSKMDKSLQKTLLLKRTSGFSNLEDANLSYFSNVFDSDSGSEKEFTPAPMSVAMPIPMPTVDMPIPPTITPTIASEMGTANRKIHERMQSFPSTTFR
ncbi:hypothetical protein ABW19_dt0204545 [Dactylella cylindrospora]|nr:hypothetical protein ABW19_dt0204545 [Dactylella cylindrospora]